MERIPLARPWIDERELEALRSVLESGQLVQGPKVEELETRIAARCGRRFGVAVSSGTAALELALIALEIGVDDEVICPSLSWPSPGHAIALRGATPRWLDVDAASWNLDVEAIEGARSPRSKALIAIDQFGNPVDAAALEAKSRGLLLIEDAACALGSAFSAERACGSLGLISCLSFHPRKLLTTGEGGMCLCDDPALAETLRILRNHGQRRPGEFVRASGNYRLSEVAAAIGLVQLDKLDALIEERRFWAKRYRETLDLEFQRCPAGAHHNVQTLGALLPPRFDASARDQLLTEVREEGVELGRLSYGMHRLASLETAAAPCPRSDDILARGLALPLLPGMSEAQFQRVVVSLVRRL